MSGKLLDKKLKKKIDGKCYFCSCSDYRLLDVHRIQPGKEDGTYTDINTISCCANCHRKIHSNQIIIVGKYQSTAGEVLIYLENGVEKIKAKNNS